MEGTLVKYEEVKYYKKNTKKMEAKSLNHIDVDISEEVKNNVQYFLLLQDVLEFYKTTLHTSEGESGLAYLREVGISEKTIKDFNIGYASKQSILLHLKKLGYSGNEIKNSGLIIKNNGQNINLFNEMLIYPVYDTSKNIIGIIGQKIDFIDTNYSADDYLIYKCKELKNNPFFFNMNNFEPLNQHVIINSNILDTLALFQNNYNNAITLFDIDKIDKYDMLSIPSNNIFIWINYKDFYMVEKAIEIYNLFVINDKVIKFIFIEDLNYLNPLEILNNSKWKENEILNNKVIGFYDFLERNIDIMLKNENLNSCPIQKVLKSSRVSGSNVGSLVDVMCSISKPKLSLEDLGFIEYEVKNYYYKEIDNGKFIYAIKKQNTIFISNRIYSKELFDYQQIDIELLNLDKKIIIGKSDISEIEELITCLCIIEGDTENEIL